MAKKSLRFRKALPYSSRDNDASFSVSINDFESVPSCRRWHYPVIRLLINREVIRNLPWIHFLARTKMIKTVILLPKPLERMAQTFFRLPQCLIKQMLHDLLYIFLWQTLKPLSTHIRWRKSFLCRFFFSPPTFPSRYSRSQHTLISRKAFWGENTLMGIFHHVNRQPATVSSLVALANKKSHQLREMACFCCFIRCGVFMLPVAHA